MTYSIPSSFRFTPTEAFTDPSMDVGSSIPTPSFSTSYSLPSKFRFDPASTFNNPAMDVARSASASSSEGGFNWLDTAQAIGMAAEGIGNGIRAFRGEPPIPGGMLAQYMGRQRQEEEDERLRALFASASGSNPTTVVAPVTTDEDNSTEEDEETSYEEDKENVAKLVEMYTMQAPKIFRLAGSIFSKPPAFGLQS
jgi:hypothetical protein